MISHSRLLNPRQAADFLGISPITMCIWRSRPERNPYAPAFVRCGRSIRYKLEDLENFVAANRVTPRKRKKTAPPPPRTRKRAAA